jgi:hypothetical protein
MYDVDEVNVHWKGITSTNNYAEGNVPIWWE